MSCHLSHRLTTVHRAISMALLCSISYAALSSSANAATIGKTVVTSAQHEPLVASIVVTDIRAADFSASLANSAIYQQMGLTQTDSMTVRFRPTSATSGQVVITTSKPVSKPFADVVLTINDKGQRNVIPKTLLMPLNDSLPIKTPKSIVTGAAKPNLPSVSASNARPLTVRKGAPPPLMSTSDLSASQPSTNASGTTRLPVANVPVPSIQNPAVQAPSVTAPTATPSEGDNLAYAPNRLDNGRLDNGQLDNGRPNANARTSDANTIGSNVTDNAINNVSNDNFSNDNFSNDNFSNDNAFNNKNVASNIINETPAPVVTDKQLDILNIQVTRQIQPSGEKAANMVAASPTVATTDTDAVNALSPNSDPSTTTNTTASTGNIPTNITASEAITSTAVSDNNAVSSDVSASSATAQYQVQRNDSLWLIAQQIAQENNLDVPIVMKQIQAQNPDAFINKDADQLKADAKLSLPSYDVIPSQKKLESAINAQRQYSRRASTPAVTKRAQPPSKKPSEIAKASKPPETPAVTKTQTLPQAQFSVLAPDRSGSADGTQTKSATKTGKGLSTDILATLKSSRQSTATQAQQLSKTSSALDSYTKKIQLQNQKLAELQARLKKLRNQ
ncbi:peptigoglycan-binding protein LysM [Psychrobacter sp. B38]|uniref:type IV pilus assembly protein FimV n=1 Tax=Psychrobacter sp. B38 TaxID=3143538 RepID=UPI00320D3CBE